jgi:hypothetical protein
LRTSVFFLDRTSFRLLQNFTPSFPPSLPPSLPREDTSAISKSGRCTRTSVS